MPKNPDATKSTTGIVTSGDYSGEAPKRPSSRAKPNPMNMSNLGAVLPQVEPSKTKAPKKNSGKSPIRAQDTTSSILGNVEYATSNTAKHTSSRAVPNSQQDSHNAVLPVSNVPAVANKQTASSMARSSNKNAQSSGPTAGPQMSRSGNKNAESSSDRGQEGVSAVYKNSTSTSTSDGGSGISRSNKMQSESNPGTSAQMSRSGNKNAQSSGPTAQPAIGRSPAKNVQSDGPTPQPAVARQYKNQSANAIDTKGGIGGGAFRRSPSPKPSDRGVSAGVGGTNPMITGGHNVSQISFG